MFCEDQTIPSSCSSLNDLSLCSTSSDSIVSQQFISYEDITIIKQLNKAKFPVFLAQTPSNGHYFAMKVFPYTNNKVSPYFLNEARFAALDHSNVISTMHCEFERDANFEADSTCISYIVMELAPYGDFFDTIMTRRIRFDDKLARTYFHQLIEGLEYLHVNGVSHMDLKLENLLLGEGFVLKIADFDQAHIQDQESVLTKGTVNYRAPELINRRCKDPKAADIYSAGIILFLFRSGGILPHLENNKFQGIDLFYLMNNDKELFWEKHCEVQRKKVDFFDKDFKALFDAMVGFNPEDRPSIEMIKKSKWYNKPVYSKEEVSLYMNQFFVRA